MSRLSPRIASLRWGEVALTDGRRFKDVKLYPGGAREWDWHETGTRHSPGVQMADIQELLDHGATTIIVSRGQLGRLTVPDQLVRELAELGVEILVHTTPTAVKVYNECGEHQPVGALIHSTC